MEFLEGVLLGFLGTSFAGSVIDADEIEQELPGVCFQLKTLQFLLGLGVMRGSVGSTRIPARFSSSQGALLGNVVDGVLGDSLVVLHQLVGSLVVPKIIGATTLLLEAIQLLRESLDLARYSVGGAAEGVQRFLRTCGCKQFGGRDARDFLRSQPAVSQAYKMGQPWDIL